MKVLMLTTNSTLLDGINRHILAVAPFLNRMPGLEVAVCTVMKRGELAEALGEEGVVTYPLDCKNGHGIQILWRFLNVLRTFNPDVVHFQSSPALFEQMVLALAFRRITLVRTIHGLVERRKPSVRDRLDSWIRGFFPLRYHALGYVSKGVRDGWKDNAMTQGVMVQEVVYNPIAADTTSRAESFLRQVLGVEESTKVIGSACRFAKQKNPEALVRVMCCVLAKHGGCHAVLVGDGDEDMKKRLVEMIEASGVKDRFHLLGYRPDAKRLISGLNCFLMTSRTEGMPTALLEAMIGGTPVAFWKGTGGLQDLGELNEKQGHFAIVAEQGDVAGLAEGVSLLLADEEKAKEYADKARSVCQQFFSVGATAAKWASIYGIMRKEE